MPFEHAVEALLEQHVEGFSQPIEHWQRRRIGEIAAVHKIFATFEDAAAKMPALFPDSSRSEANSPEADDFSPTPKVWEDMADFKARFVKFGEDAKAAAASVKDLDGFKAAFGNIGKNDCGACHEQYRAKKS